MAEIDRIVQIDLLRDGSSSTTAEQDIVALRVDLASTESSKGAGMVGYLPSDDYPVETVGNAINDLQKNMQNSLDKSDQAIQNANEALSKATTAEGKIDNALLKGNNLNDLSNKATALVNLGAVALADISENPVAGKTPKAGSDGKMDMSWIRDLTTSLKKLEKEIESIKYPDGKVPYLDWDMTAGYLPEGMDFTRGTQATYFDQQGILRVAQENEPVFEYDPVTKKALGLRKERDSFNKMSYSNFNSSYWSTAAGAVVNVNYSFSPDGTVTSNFLTTDATEEDPKVPYIHRRYIQYDAGKNYTSSVFMKINPNLDSSKVVRLVLHAEVYGGSNRNVYFVPATGRVYVSTGSEPKDWGFQDCGGGWIRIWMTDTISEDWGGGTGWGPLIWFSNFISQGQGVEWWGMQVEEGVTPTSYIPTNGAGVTRVREQCIYRTDKVYISNKASIYFEHIPTIPLELGGVTGGFAIVIGEGGNNLNYLGVDYDNVLSDGRTQIYLRDGTTSNKGAIVYGVREFGKVMKYAFRFSPDTVMAVSCNGSSINTSPNPVLNSYFEMANRITFFGTSVSGTGNIRGSGYIRKIKIFNELFEDDRLIEMST